jgi:hypothetical protein
MIMIPVHKRFRNGPWHADNNHTTSSPRKHQK